MNVKGTLNTDTEKTEEARSTSKLGRRHPEEPYAKTIREW